MTDNKPGPVRVEEPQGYDRTPTERIPVAGDLSDTEKGPRPTDDTVDGRREAPDQEPVAGAGTAEPRREMNADGHDPLADRRDQPADGREMTTESRDLPTDGSGAFGDHRNSSGEPTDGEHRVTGSAVTEELPAEPLAGTGSPAATEPSTSAGMFEESTVNRFRDRWRELQAGFVDDPARAVRGADELVEEIMRDLAERKQHLEGGWRDGTEDTERLRVAIKEYRSFFNQLLNV